MTAARSPRDADIGALVLAAPEHPAVVRAVAAERAESVADRAGGVALVTCQRVEVYGLDARLEPERDGAWSEATLLRGSAAIRHVTGVGLGLESAVLAEDQVLHQLRAAVSRARRERVVAPSLQLVFDAVLRAARIGRSWRPSTPRSLADLAVERILGAPGTTGAHASPPVLVVGAGEMGRLAARAAATRGCRVIVASRSRAHADDVAAATGTEAITLDEIGAALAAGVRGVVVALAGAWPIDRSAARVLAGAPIVVDLSVPSALPGTIIEGLGDRFADVDAIARRATAGIADRADDRYRRRLEALRDRTADEIERRLAVRANGDVRGRLADRIERERAAELDALWRSLPALPSGDRAVIDGMTRHLAKRLLGEPLARLGADPDGRRASAARELFDL